VTLPRTPSQTVGPFFAFGLSSRPHQSELVAAGSAGVISIEGRVLDGAGAPVPDGLVEIWQADAEGRYDGGWGWGRCATDADGHFAFSTLKPGAVREPDGSTHAPHVTVLCFARGLLKPVLTRIYFPDEAEANAADRVLRAVDESVRATLIARESGAGAYRFDMRLQGDGQTVFFTTPASGL
jgi:protocatechuate 3,4-dioxygenase, alpha subunit